MIQGPAGGDGEADLRPGAKGDSGAARSEGYCFCLICGHRERLSASQLCSSERCPKCGARMMHN
jgi:hypothetical protein